MKSVSKKLNLKYLSELNYKKILKNQNFFLLLAIILLSLIVGTLNPRFLSWSNFWAVSQQIAVLGIVTMSMSLLLISGEIDLSIGNMMGLSTVIMCRIVMNDFNLVFAVILGFLVPVLCGFINGIIISKSKTEPLIITLGMSYAYYGFALVVSQGLFLSMRGKFQYLGRGRIFVIPVPLIILLLIIISVYVLLKYTKYGRRVVAMGGNEELAFLSGINIDRYKVFHYTLSGAIIGVASLVLVSRLGNVLANVGDGYALRALAAAIIGGITFEGGKGTVIGAFLGVILLGIVNNSLNILGVSSYFQTVFLGAIIVIAVLISSLGDK